MQVNDIVGYLELHNRFTKNRRAYWNCGCLLCGNEKDIREDTLQSGKQKSCGCYQKSEEWAKRAKERNPIEDLSGKVFSELTVLYMSDRRVGKKILWWCLCSCGNLVEVWSANLKNGNSKTCGDYEAHRKVLLQEAWAQNLDDLTGKIFGDWLVVKRDGLTQPTRWICVCQNCETVKSVIGSTLKKGQSTSCGCRKRNETLSGKRIGHWLVGERSKRRRPNGHYCTTYLCKCDCGATERYVDESRLLNGTSLSCGCVKSRANEYISQVLSANYYEFTTEYKYCDLIGPGGGLLRFDFAILDDENNVICLLEYQGEQHFLDGEFGKQQREITDPMKRKYCKEHNIKLFEITYLDNIDEKLDELFTHIAC